MHGLDLPPHYPAAGDKRHRALHALSRPRYAVSGEAHNSEALFFDSGSTQTIWHRIYLEAVIPDHCGVKVHVAASDLPLEDPNDPGVVWHEHHFGETTARSLQPNTPRGAWASYPSEVPFHEGLLYRSPERDKAGLFTALVQRTGHAVSEIRGRYLQVRIELIGDGRTTPEVAALRVYGPRFSYVENYLPEIYKEVMAGPDADALTARTTQHDFLDRFVANFEGVLTPLEDRIANAHLLTDPASVPSEAIEWLGSWIGVTFDPAYPREQWRLLLQRTPELFRTRGTLDGLRLALDLATRGACSRGEIVVVEDYRLRRTFATILGADLADEEDPLLAGLVRSGNSIVGDTLILGDETRKEFLALYDVDVTRDATEEQAIEAFLESLAFQVTILVHQASQALDTGLIERIVQLETPAHVLCRVVRTSLPLLVGVASLVGVDTFLTEEPAPAPVRVGESQLGIRDFVLRPASLDPRIEGATPISPAGQAIPPIAEAGPDQLVPLGQPFVLDGSQSSPGSGGDLALYIWTLLDS